MTLDEQIGVICDWASIRLSKYVCVANVHMLMEAYKDPNFNQVLKGADLVTADGMPLVILMRLFGAQFQNRVAGMDIFKELCRQASEKDISIFFLGSEDHILASIQNNLIEDFPNLKIAGMLPLPFREMSAEEDQSVVEFINRSGAGIVFVSLGCPKQEKWIAKHRGKVQATMLGVGAVFPVYAGIYKLAPDWMRNLSLEWLYRLCQEPKRLWRRYLYTIPPFLYLATRQLINEKLFKRLKVNLEKFTRLRV